MAWLLPFFEGDPYKLDQTLTLMRTLLPYLAIVCIIAQCQGVLNSLKQFFVPALSPILINLACIAAALIAGFAFAGSHGKQALFIAAGIMAGGVMQIALFVLALRHNRFPIRPSFGFRDDL